MPEKVKLCILETRQRGERYKKKKKAAMVDGADADPQLITDEQRVGSDRAATYTMAGASCLLDCVRQVLD